MPHSIIPQFPQNIDNRILSMDVKFYMLSIENVKRLAAEFWEFVQNVFQNDFIIRSEWGDRKKGFRIDLKKEIDAAQDEIDFCFEGDFVSSLVHSTKTFRQFDNLLLFDWHSRRGMPEDYAACYHTLFPYRQMSVSAIRQSLVELFSMPGKIPAAPFPNHDFSGRFMGLSYWNHPEMYRGTFELTIAKECLGTELSCIANAMAIFMESISCELHNIGGFVRIGSSLNMDYTPYMYYFGNDYRMDGSHELAHCFPIEWYPYYYHNGIEWFNILTPLAAEKLRSRTPNSQLLCRELESGAIIVQLRKPIEHSDVSDYTIMKDYLYPALLPGMSQIPINVLLDPEATGYLAKPRMSWEILPISPEEIFIENGNLILRHL